MSNVNLVTNYLEEHISVTNEVLSSDIKIKVTEAADLIIKSFESGNKLLLCGNGGSAADAQHLAAEFVVRFESNRKALPAIALNTNGSVYTAAVNDLDKDEVFNRQIEALGNEDDVLLAISTSGNSTNVIKAVDKAKEKGMKTILFLGKDGGLLKGKGDLEVIIPSNITSFVQEMHIMLGHIICKIVDQYYDGY